MVDWAQWSRKGKEDDAEPGRHIIYTTPLTQFLYLVSLWYLLCGTYSRLQMATGPLGPPVHPYVDGRCTADFLRDENSNEVNRTTKEHRKTLAQMAYCVVDSAVLILFAASLACRSSDAYCLPRAVATLPFLLFWSPRALERKAIAASLLEENDLKGLGRVG